MNKNLSINSVAKAANLDINELLVLNPSYKKQIINGSVQIPKSLVIPGVENSFYTSLYNLLNGIENEKPEIFFASPKLADKSAAEVPGKISRVSEPSRLSSKPEESGYKRYIVKVGDTLSGIAEKFSGMTVSKIKALNGLTKSVIKPGMTLIINRL